MCRDEVIRLLFEGAQRRISEIEAEVLFLFPKNRAMLSDTDTAKADMKKKERIFKEKESFVLMVHRTDDGVPRKINEPKPGAKGQTGLWNTKMSDGKRPTSKTYEGLIEKL